MITVRKAGVDDVPRILDIIESSISPVWTLASVQSELDKDDTLFIVAVDENTALGFAVFRQVGDDGELLQIATCPTARRKGVADKLLHNTLEYAAQKGFCTVHLEVRVGNAAAIGLYEKHGFKHVRIRADYYNDPNEDALIMVRSTPKC
ncbi:MAG: ribosomal protein S18-alanine N-acetyltransferase [Oscillospiraceae bacterium]|nr:ribosomal protein S18-alanine N-acetyltransferase [Oscillospiraceae bacterium]